MEKMTVIRGLKSLALLFSLAGTLAFAQAKSGTTYVSSIDQSLTIRKLVILPFNDNVSSIYGKPVTERALETQKRLHLWEAEQVEGSVDTGSPKAVQAFLKAQKAEALLIGSILKGPESIQMVVSILSAMDGRVLYQARRIDIKGFNTEDILKEFDSLHQELINQVPFRGLVLSRRGQE
ncbi:MAG: hypothetical protein V4736_10385, partial [Bdellovibrionota bacterium]